MQYKIEINQSFKNDNDTITIIALTGIYIAFKYKNDKTRIESLHKFTQRLKHFQYKPI